MPADYAAASSTIVAACLKIHAAVFTSRHAKMGGEIPHRTLFAIDNTHGQPIYCLPVVVRGATFEVPEFTHVIPQFLSQRSKCRPATHDWK